MIYLLHGPDVVSSQSFLANLKKSYPDIIVLSGKKKTAEDLNLPKEANLFGHKKLLIVEDFVPKEKEPIEEIESADIILVNQEILVPPKWVSKSWLFKQAETLSNFKLVDQVVSGQKRQAQSTLAKLLKQKTPPELIIGSLVRQLRLLSLASVGEIESVSKSEFVQKKTKELAQNWNLTKIKKALILILKTDFEIKSGLINQNITLINLVENLTNLAKT